MDEQHQERWDVVVGEPRPWWHIEVREIWRYRDLLWLLVRRDLLAIYKQSLLGPLWQVLQPVLTAVAFAVVFGWLGRMADKGVPPVLFYLSAIVPWTFFANVVNRTSQTLIWNAALMTKVYFPRILSPLATTLSTAFSFLVQLAAFAALAVGYHATTDFAWHLDSGILMLPVLIALLTILAFGAGVLVSALTTRFRDLGFLLGFAIQLLMYVSPVIFPLDSLPPASGLRRVLEVNPMTPLIEGFRAALLGGGMDVPALWYPLLFACILLAVGTITFHRVQRSFADVI
ncbi:MAG: ABC transporter permease [Flavobacteriales bacterium]|nr:ABC transporter permease [Flavobacteriales bacterium]